MPGAWECWTANTTSTTTTEETTSMDQLQIMTFIVVGATFALYIGIAIWACGLSFEAIGDLQLTRFKANSANAGRIMDRGLWAWTRHPNYFGDFLVWWGLFAITLGSAGPWPLIAALGPALMSFLLLRLSGVPLLERRMRRSRPGYAEYVNRTSEFFPRPPRSE